MMLRCTCETDHEEKFVCDFCCERAKWYVEMMNLFNYETFTDEKERLSVTRIRFLVFMQETLNKDYQNGKLSYLNFAKAEEAIENLHSVFYWQFMMGK